MVDYLNVPAPSSPPPPAPHISSLPMMFYCFVAVVAVAVAVVAVAVVAVAVVAVAVDFYNLIIVRWCTRQETHLLARTTNTATPNNHPHNTMSPPPPPPPPPSDNSGGGLVLSFTYKKEGDDNEELECSVCLSVFEQGEQVRKLTLCNHSFHASCINMWLYSHSHCPLCRALVVEPPPPPPPLTIVYRQTDSALSSDRSQDELLNPATSSV